MSNFVPWLLLVAVVQEGNVAEFAPAPFILQVGPDHCVYRRTANVARQQDGRPILEVLTDPLVTQELDLVDWQQDALMKMRIRYDKEDRVGSKDDSQNPAESVDSLGRMSSVNRSAIQDRIDADIRDVLVPLQVSRLQRLLFRYSVHACGDIESLRSVLRERLRIRDDVWPRITQEWGGLLLEVNDVFRKEAARIEAESLEVLSDEQRKVVESIVGDVARYRVPCFEIFVYQVMSESTREGANVDMVAEYVFCGTGLRAGVSGQLHRDDVFTLGDAYPHLMWMLVGASRSSQYYGQVELIEISSELAAVDVNASNQSAVRQLQVSLTALRQDVSSERIGVDTYIKRAGKLHAELTGTMLRNYLKTLPDSQTAEIERLLLRRLIALRGLPSCLEAGALGRRVAISEQQREELRKRRAQWRNGVEKISREMEERWWAVVINNCDSSQQREIRELIGGPSVNVLGMPTVFALPAWTIGRRIPCDGQ